MSLCLCFLLFAFFFKISSRSALKLSSHDSSRAFYEQSHREQQWVILADAVFFLTQGFLLHRCFKSVGRPYFSLFSHSALFCFVFFYIFWELFPRSCIPIYFFLHVAQFQVPLYTFPSYGGDNPYTEQRSIHYPKPGAVNPTVQVIVYDFEKRTNITLLPPKSLAKR